MPSDKLTELGVRKAKPSLKQKQLIVESIADDEVFLFYLVSNVCFKTKNIMTIFSFQLYFSSPLPLWGRQNSNFRYEAM